MSSLPQPTSQELAEVDLSRMAEAAWIIDVAEARVIGASPKGRTLLGDFPGEGAPLDRAMPALRELKQLKLPNKEQGELRSLLLWTRKGAVRMTCLCRALSGLGPKVFLVSQEPEPAAPADPSRAAATSRSHARLAHELRTPLGAIAALAEVMKEERLGAMGNPRYLSYAADIYESARHALAVVDAMMGDGRASCHSGEPTYVDVNGIASKALAIMRELARQANARLTADLEADQAQVQADGRALLQILINLIANSLKAVPPGGTVTIATRPEVGGEVTLSVSDDGPGMDREILSLLEADKLRAPENQASQHASGQGLAIVQELTHSIGARLQIESAPGRGTRVSIIFPQERVFHTSSVAR